jgi:hypothetical protein
MFVKISFFQFNSESGLEDALFRPAAISNQILSYARCYGNIRNQALWIMVDILSINLVFLIEFHETIYEQSIFKPLRN